MKKILQFVFLFLCFLISMTVFANAACEHNFELMENRKNLICYPDGFHSYRCQNGCGAEGTAELGVGGKDKCDFNLISHTAPDCTKEGKEIYICTVCFNRTEINSEKIGHNYKKTVILPTCTGYGYDLYKCTVCDKSYRENIRNPISHLSDGGEVKALPTYEKSGLLVSSCRMCGAELDRRILEKLNGFDEKEKAPEKVKGFRVKSVSASSVKLTWEGVDRALKYKIFYSADKKKWKIIFTENTYVTVKNLSQSKLYYFKIIAVGNDADSAESLFTVCTKPKKAELVSVKSAKESEVTLEWKKISNVSGYEISYTASGFGNEKTVKKINTSKKCKKAIKKLKSGKKYRFRIRAYKIYGSRKVFGAYSKIRILKIK